jgi:hypothetical protein
VRKTSKVIVAHEDMLSWGYGAEIAARIGDELFHDLDAPVRRVAAMDTFVAYQPLLEDAILPQPEDLYRAMAELAASRRGFMKGGALALVGDVGDSGVSVAQRAGRGDDGGGEQEEAGGAVPARRGGWVECRGAVQGEELLRDAADDCDQAEGCAGSGWVLWAASADGGVQAAVRPGASGDRSCGGSPDTTRSHFDAQDYMESGTPGVKVTEDGWLNRALQASSGR